MKKLSTKPTFEEIDDLMSSERDIELDDDAFDAIICKRLNALKASSPVQFDTVEAVLDELKQAPLEWDGKEA